MNIVVCVKQTFDTEAKISLNPEGKIESSGVNLIVNPYDEFALEEGIRLKEKFGGEVTVVSVGGPRVGEALRTALAMGADKAIAFQVPSLDETDEYATALVLTQIMQTLNYDIILAGRIAIDDGSSQVAVRLAENLGIPSVTSILELQLEGGKAKATKDIDGGSEVIEVALPAVFTAQKGLNEPRYPTVAGIMKAKKKELRILSPTDLNLTDEDLKGKMKITTVSLPSPRQAGRLLSGEAKDAAAELARVLSEEAKVI